MQGTTFYIKNMVCNRCIMAVEQLLGRLHFTVLHVELGKAVVGEVPDETSVEQLRRELETLGFELLDDRRMQLIEQVRHLVIDLVLAFIPAVLKKIILIVSRIGGVNQYDEKRFGKKPRGRFVKYLRDYVGGETGRGGKSDS